MSERLILNTETHVKLICTQCVYFLLKNQHTANNTQDAWDIKMQKVKLVFTDFMGKCIYALDVMQWMF